VLFFDCEFYIVDVKVVKHFILFGDLKKGLYVMLWAKSIKQLAFLAKTRPCFRSMRDIYAVEFVVDGQSLNVIGIDGQSNLQCCSISGSDLTMEAEMHVGAPITKFVKLMMRPRNTAPSAVSSSSSLPCLPSPPRTLAVGAAVDGSLQLLCPTDKELHSRLNALNNLLITEIAHTAGLNPLAFRKCNTVDYKRAVYRTSVVDCSLVWKYSCLDVDMQYRLARRIGSTVDQLYTDLLSIELVTGLS
jgi:hypothetical protein